MLFFLDNLMRLTNKLVSKVKVINKKFKLIYLLIYRKSLFLKRNYLINFDFNNIIHLSVNVWWRNSASTLHITFRL